MSLEAQRTTRKPPGLNGRHVLGAFLTFFAAVFVANGAMIYSALSTHTGLVANEPYRKGLHYNERIAADARQGRLGWVGNIELSIDGRVSLALAESDGRPVRGLRIEGVLGRPSTNRHDVRLALAEKGSGPLRGASRASGGRQLDGDAGSLHQRKPRRAHLPRAEASMAQALTQPGLCQRGAIAGGRCCGCPPAAPPPRWQWRTCTAAPACAKSRPRSPPSLASRVRAPTCPPGV